MPEDRVRVRVVCVGEVLFGVETAVRHTEGWIR
jgi:hypothetical protein